MSRKFKQHYSGYNREILKEFMTEEELNEMDKKYTNAKLIRMARKISPQFAEQLKIVKSK